MSNQTYPFPKNPKTVGSLKEFIKDLPDDMIFLCMDEQSGGEESIKPCSIGIVRPEQVGFSSHELFDYKTFEPIENILVLSV